MKTLVAAMIAASTLAVGAASAQPMYHHHMRHMHHMMMRRHYMMMHRHHGYMHHHRY